MILCSCSIINKLTYKFAFLAVTTIMSSTDNINLLIISRLTDTPLKCLNEACMRIQNLDDTGDKL